MPKPDLTPLELGRMSLREMEDHVQDAGALKEVMARHNNYWLGRAGESAKLTEYEVRALLGPLLIRDDRGQSLPLPAPLSTWNDAIHACARALLGLPPDAPSPLSDPEPPQR